MDKHTLASQALEFRNQACWGIVKCLVDVDRDHVFAHSFGLDRRFLLYWRVERREGHVDCWSQGARVCFGLCRGAQSMGYAVFAAVQLKGEFSYQRGSRIKRIWFVYRKLTCDDVDACLGGQGI